MDRLQNDLTRSRFANGSSLIETQLDYVGSIPWPVLQVLYIMVLRAVTSLIVQMLLGSRLGRARVQFVSRAVQLDLYPFYSYNSSSVLVE
jgi:hypothetical protein